MISLHFFLFISIVPVAVALPIGRLTLMLYSCCRTSILNVAMTSIGLHPMNKANPHGAGSLPNEMSLNFFQIDLQDPISDGADMLSDDSLQSLPDLALARTSSGRFFVISDPEGGCTQCSITITSLTEANASVSVPFNFSPSFGLLLMTLAFSASRYATNRINKNILDNS